MITLQHGDQNEKVELLNKRLRELGYAAPEGDKFDDETEAAVKQFQQDSYLTVDGIVGEQTLHKLELQF